MLSSTDALCDTTYVSNGFKLSDMHGSVWQGTEFQDTVHGTFHLGPICSLAEGTTPVQRLRQLKQLGSTYLGPFPSAVHTRHEHSLGTAHLAGRCMLQLADTEQDIRALDVELTALAGLCHDLGHGPFSHSFDAFLDASMGPQHYWRHEEMSCKLLEVVVSEAKLDLDTQQLQHVQDMIDNGPHRPLRQLLQPDQAWRLQIVGNAGNSLDIDKVDYECRDVIMTGMQQQLDCSHFIPLVTQHCKVLSGHICFDQQQQQHVAALYDVRAALHERVYQHPMAKSAQLMIADALAAAEPVLQVASKLDDPQDFLTLDDTIVQQVQAAARRKGAQPCLCDAAAVLQRLQQAGSMYFMAALAELQLEHHQRPHQRYGCGHQMSGNRLTVDDLVCCQQSGAAERLTAADLRLYFYSIDYCFGDEDPLDRIFLYDASSSRISRKASDGLDRSHKTFLTNRVRVYVAKQCSTSGERQAYKDAASAALCSALRERYGTRFKLLDCSSNGGSGSAWGLRQSAAEAAVDMRSVAVAMVQQQRDQSRVFLSNSWNSNASSEETSASRTRQQAATSLATAAAAATAEAPSGDMYT